MLAVAEVPVEPFANLRPWVILTVATIHMEDGFRFRVFPNDHAPAHVHAWKGGASVVIQLPTLDAPAKILRINGTIKNSDVVRAVEIVQDNAGLMWEGWHRFHD